MMIDRLDDVCVYICMCVYVGVIIQPMALDAKGEENIDVVNFGSTVGR